jgi:ubiquinone/menaquinone biosynthesis C-methylase UbiE
MSLAEHYDRHILPHLIDWVMQTPMATREREELIPQAHGEVLEIGAGSGLNFPYYGPDVTRLFALEPQDKLISKARKRLNRLTVPLAFPVEFLGLKGESVPLADASIDTVVSTWVLCSIKGVEAALREIHRVLKPNGAFLFIEHGLAPTPVLAGWQNRLTPIWSCCAGGCHLNRRPDVLIESASFTLESIERTYLDGPKLLTYHYKGLARRA